MAQDIAGFSAVQEYWTDAWQRGVLFLDVLRERGNNALEHAAKEVPNVLDFPGRNGDGRPHVRAAGQLRRWCASFRLPDAPSIRRKPPIIVVDPRAGHGPGIGGMKHDSEIGVALKAGHPCYFVGFLPKPMPGQTIEDVCRAEAMFIETVADAHPEAEGKPIVIGNCQAGWQIMMMAAVQPGPARARSCSPASPLSYWAGVRGKNPMRYLGGLLGGTWLTALAGDLGARHLRRRRPGRQFRVAQSRPTPIGPSPTTSIRRSTPRPSASSNSRHGGAARCC